eukprot:scaffold5202_cov133-Skeletonema_dohrnii-CCMP3373.AAC.4
MAAHITQECSAHLIIVAGGIACPCILSQFLSSHLHFSVNRHPTRTSNHKSRRRQNEAEGLKFGIDVV